jgi:hypothetical protein
MHLGEVAEVVVAVLTVDLINPANPVAVAGTAEDQEPAVTSGGDSSDESGCRRWLCFCCCVACVERTGWSLKRPCSGVPHKTGEPENLIVAPAVAAAAGIGASTAS